MRHLEQRSGKPVAVRHGGLLDRPPAFPGPQPPGYRAGKLNLRFLTVAECDIGIPHFVGSHFLRNFQRADVARFLDNAFNRERSVVVGIADGEAAETKTARTGVYQRLRLHAAGFERHRHGNGFHRRARLEGVGDGAVAQLLAGQVLPPVGNIARVVGQRQHFAGNRVEHDHAAGLGLVGDHSVAQLLIGEKLHLAVDAQLDILAFDGRHLLADTLDHAAQTVLDNTP